MPAGDAKTNIYAFDDILVERDNYRLFRGGEVRAIEPRAFDLLVYLIEHPGRVVTKEELFEHIWKRSFVTDSALTQEIRQIRQVLGDDAANPRYIETIPKHGYRFVAEVSVRGEEEGGPPYDSLAILPFANLNSDPELDYFVVGITDLLITDLGKIGALKVISRTSTNQYKETRKPLPQIALELKVKAIVEGAVMRIGDRVRVTVQLIDATTDYHIWAESYERKLTDILSLQKEVARAVAGQIRITLSPDEAARLSQIPKIDPEAYEAWLKGNYLLLKFVPGGVQKAIEFFRTAIRLEPSYAAAYAALGDAYGNLGYWGILPPREIIPHVRAAAAKAMELDETLCDSHIVLGKFKLYYELDLVSAERHFQRAVELSPNDINAGTHHALALLLLRRMDEALAEIKHITLLDPLSVPVSAIVGFHYFALGDKDRAIEVWRQTLEIEPMFLLSRWFLWRAYRLLGMFDEAINEFVSLPMMYDRAVVEAATARYRQSGYHHAMRDAAAKLAEQSRIRYIPPTHVAMLYAHAEENEQAMDWLERAYEAHDPKLVAVGIEPDWEHLRSYPRFHRMLDRFGLQ